MEVQKIENFKMPNAVAHEITQEELQRDFDYYRAQKVLETAKLSHRFWRRLWAK